MEKNREQACCPELIHLNPKPLHDRMVVYAVDVRSNGGANHHYTISFHSEPGCAEPGTIPETLFINFQDGPVNEAGCNGISDDALLAILIHRLQGFQSGPFACRENACALTKLQEAQHWLEHRANDRIRRGVEGYSKA